MSKSGLLGIFFGGLVIGVTACLGKPMIDNLRQVDWRAIGKQPDLISPFAPLPSPTPFLLPVVQEKLKPPMTILIIGDSMILEGFGPRIESDLIKYKGVTVIRDGEYSTGLNRRDHFDWGGKARKLIDAVHPRVMIAMFGANDGQRIKDSGGHMIRLDDPSWDLIYAGRVNDFMSHVSPRVEKIYWIGQPIAKTDDFRLKFLRMNKIYQEEAKKFANIAYVSTWERFSVNGQYTPAVADDSGLRQLVKEDDGVHLTEHGARIMSRFVMTAMKGDIEF